jgi:hypothetical protein
MGKIKSREQRRAAFMEIAGEMYEEMEDWYEAHPEASFGEIEAEIRRKRREMMGETVRILVNERDRGFQLNPPKCEQCKGELEFEGYRGWTVRGLEGDTRLKRAYYVCPQCEGETLFPPGSQTETESGSLE